MIEVARGAQTRDPAGGCQSGNHANFPQIFSKCGDGVLGWGFWEKSLLCIGGSAGRAVDRAWQLAGAGIADG